MNRPSTALVLPKPGPALKVVLLVLFVVGAAQSLLSNQPVVMQVLDLFGCDAWRVGHGQVWRLLTAGLLTDPRSIGPLLFTLMGLYFFATELETLWGAARLVRFLVLSTVMANALAVAVDLLAPGDMTRLHSGMMVGAYAMTSAAIVAWSRINMKTPVRLFYLVPMTGAVIFWITVAACAWCLYSPGSEGPVAPLGGVAAGMALGGAGKVSPMRRAYLKLKLSYLQARGGGRTPTAHEIAFGKPAPKRPRSGGPPLRLLPGGRDSDGDADKPKDKRYLN